MLHHMVPDMLFKEHDIRVMVVMEEVENIMSEISLRMTKKKKKEKKIV